MPKWVSVGEGGTCECGSTDQVIKWKNKETGETRRVCVNCNDAAGAARRAGR